MDSSIIYNTEHKKIRIGKDNDGGYVIAELPGDYSILLSGGVSDDISFECALINKYNNLFCFAFDGTIDNLPTIHPSINFIKKNLGNKTNENNTNLFN